MPDSGTSATDIAAWVGAVGSLFGTFAFGWDVYKWRKRGAEISVQLFSNMAIRRLGVSTNEPEASLVIVDVINRGAVPTTITNLVGALYTSPWQRLPLLKPRTQLWIKPMLEGGQVPHVLNPGEVWKAILPQNGFDDLLTKGRVRIGVCHSGADKPIYGWLRVRAETPNAS